MTRRSKREVASAVDDLEVGQRGRTLTMMDHVRLTGDATPSDHGMTERDVDEEWRMVLREHGLLSAPDGEGADR